MYNQVIYCLFFQFFCVFENVYNKMLGVGIDLTKNTHTHTHSVKDHHLRKTSYMKYGEQWSYTVVSFNIIRIIHTKKIHTLNSFLILKIKVQLQESIFIKILFFEVQINLIKCVLTTIPQVLQMQRPGTISLSSNRPLSAFPDGTHSLKIKKKQV